MEDYNWPVMYSEQVILDTEKSAKRNISWKKTYGKTKTKMGRKYEDGLLVAVEYERMVETSKG